MGAIGDESFGREICIQHSRESTDTRLYFESRGLKRTPPVLGVEGARDREGSSPKTQCGPHAEGSLRCLVLNFALADTGWPDFICWPRIAQAARRNLPHPGRRWAAASRCHSAGDVGSNAWIRPRRDPRLFPRGLDRGLHQRRQAGRPRTATIHHGDPSDLFGGPE